MDDDLLAAYLGTHYRVRLAGGGWASIRIGQPVPPALRPLVDGGTWGFITAWNPHSTAQPNARNRAAQRQLLAILRARADVATVKGAIGVGADGRWREPSLFVVGPDLPVLDALARRFQQRGYVHGKGAAPAQLRVLAPH